MGKQTMTIKDYDTKKIRSLLRKDPNYLVGIRLYAIYLVSLGQSSRKLESLFNVSYKQITNWVHRFEQQGLEGLHDKPGKGRKSKLTAHQKDEIREYIISNEPLLNGYDSNYWTVPMIQEFIKKQYGIDYQKAHIYNILRDMGFRIIKRKGILHGFS
eukprot:TRINITY_DN28060_c0_g1_i1.p1 TRINITY_DN28060_c0_g1~~TRINITY_DN28060_c0_g1_i1.p1  ORF type:complete len:157 (-),score=3.92 TRINITY_DN28060_c0_g1_i1:39-509(-)